MKQNDKDKAKALEENSEKAALKNAIIDDKDTDKVSGGVLPFPLPLYPPDEPS